MESQNNEIREELASAENPQIQEQPVSVGAEAVEEKPSAFKKVLNIVKTVLVWMVVVFAVGMMIFTIFSVNTFDQGDRGVFGYKFFIVRSDSMSATHFDAGDIVIVKEVDIRELKEGDVITFMSQSSINYGETVTHMIREVTKDREGGIAFVTYGTTSGVNDEALATFVYGKYQTKIPNLGNFFAFLKTTPGYIVCILIPFLILILSQGITCVKLFLQYRREQTAELEAERAKIEAERQETQKMMAELMALKAQLTADVNKPEAPPASAPPAAPSAEAPATNEAPTVTKSEPTASAEAATSEPTAEENNGAESSEQVNENTPS